MGKGLATAIMALILPTYILIYNWSPNTGGSLLVLQVFGVFYVSAYYSDSRGGTSSEGTAIRIFDPNWYLDLEKYLTNASYSSNNETNTAESFADHGIFAVFGNYKGIIEGDTTNVVLGVSGMLMAIFLIFLLFGIFFNLIGQQKGSGILFLFSGAAALGALFITWSMLYGLNPIGGSSPFPEITSIFSSAPGDKYVPIPFGAILVVLAGLRAFLAKPEHE
ncbi:MAG: hypothetical protein ACE5OZ_19225 [Candidatus Heimdallarchaeota archaeon]